MKEVLLINRGFHDLNPVVYGEEKCAPGHSFGPAVRAYTLLHYVVSGEGTYTVGGVTYRVKAGQAFRIIPGETTVYTADMNDPWHYCWVGFDGALSGRFATLPPVFYVPEAARTIFRFDMEERVMIECRMVSALFAFYAEMFAEDSGRHAHYVRRVKDYVRAMYMQEVRVERIAEQMNLDRRYLSRIFKEKTGQSVQEYLITVRMEEAKRCLLRGLSVSESAHRSGYEDVCNFSKMFKSRYGMSPGRWAQHSEEDKNAMNVGKKA